MASMELIRKAHIALMTNTLATLNNIFKHASPSAVTTLRDGADGWTALEVLCHLRDYDVIFLERAQSVIAQDEPHFVPRDHNQLVIDGKYNQQDVQQVVADLNASRQRFIAFFESLTPEQWERHGIHAEYGEFSLTRSLIQVGHHDANHIEQITRILAQA
jgi:hypothetical protein